MVKRYCTACGREMRHWTSIAEYSPIDGRPRIAHRWKCPSLFGLLHDNKYSWHEAGPMYHYSASMGFK